MNYSKDELFLDFAKAEFEGYLAGILYSLRDSNREYKRLKEEQKKLANKDKTVVKVLYDKEICALTEEQLQIILKLLDIEESIRMLEEKELFYLGSKEFYNYLKRLKIL